MRSAKSSAPSGLPAVWSKLSEAARDVATAAALHDRPLPAAWLTAFGAGDRAIDSLLAAGVMREGADGFSLAEKFPSVAIATLAPWSQRKRLHLVLARACLEPPPRLEPAGRHFLAAGNTAEAARALLGAAAAHCKRHHHAAATRCFIDGLRLLATDASDADVVAAVQNLARCSSLAAESQAAINFLGEWRLGPPWRDRIAVRAETALALAALLAREQRHVPSAQARREAARDLVELRRHADAATAAVAAAETLAYAVQFTAALDATVIAADASRRAGDIELESRAASLRGLVLGMMGRTAEGREHVQRALTLALENKFTGAAAEAYRLLGTVAEYASCYRDEQTAFAGALAYCRRVDATVTAGICLGCLSYSLFRSGDWKRSEATARKVCADRAVHPASRCVAEGVLGLLHAHRGELRPGEKFLRKSLETSRRLGLVAMDFFTLHGLALVAQAQGGNDEATRRYRELLDTWRASEDRHDALPGLACAVSFFAERHLDDDASEAAEAIERIAAATANPEAIGAAAAARGELRLLAEHPEFAAAEFRLALAEYEKRDLSLELIRVRMRLGAALLDSGRHDEARAVFLEARTRARRLGARPLAAQIDAALERLDGAEDSGVGSAWDLLSPRQRDVARHIAAGLSNKEIAEALGLSVRTVEMHVADVLTRLDCRSRAQAAGKIAGALN